MHLAMDDQTKLVFLYELVFFCAQILLFIKSLYFHNKVRFKIRGTEYNSLGHYNYEHEICHVVICNLQLSEAFPDVNYNTSSNACLHLLSLRNLNHLKSRISFINESGLLNIFFHIDIIIFLN